MQYKIIDNFLDETNFLSIKSIIQNYNFPWYITTNISGYEESHEHNYYMTHMFFDSLNVTSPHFNDLYPIIDRLNIFCLHRIKGNFYPSTSSIVHHKNHVDDTCPHTGAIYYINTNNGKTVLNDSIDIESIENRLLIFEPNIPHRSTTCTDDTVGRFNINFNYVTENPYARIHI